MRLIGCIAPLITFIPILGPSPSASAATFQSLYSFGQNGGAPQSRLVIDSHGVLYGTTLQGGGVGSVFSLSPPASPGGVWTEATLWSFGGPGDGQFPWGSLLLMSDGTLIGTTSNGGAYEQGIVFSLAPPVSSGAPWTEAILYNFKGEPDGAGPLGGVAIDSRGVLYGVTENGGSFNWGTVFSLTPPALASDGWAEAVLHSFDDSDGGHPSTETLLVGPQGWLVGTTFEGGQYGQGVVFLMAPPAAPGGNWTETVLHHFMGGSDGADLVAGVSAGDGGVLYGTTLNGGAYGRGIVYSLTPPATPGGSWTETILHSFGGPNLANPRCGLLVSSENGALYGTTSGRTGEYGAVFELKPLASAGGTWSILALHVFSGSDGAGPSAGLTSGLSGVLYGTTVGGGSSNVGTVFSLQH